MARNYIYCLKCGWPTKNIWRHYVDEHGKPKVRVYLSESLTPSESKIFEVLREKPGWVVSHEKLAAAIGLPWFDDDESIRDLIRQHIAKLRRKVAPAVIANEYGRGYYIEGGVYVAPDPRGVRGR